MKKILLAVMASLPFLGFAQQGSFTLSLKTKPLAVKTKAYLGYYSSGVKTIDSAEVINGTAVFRGNIPGPQRAELILDHSGRGLEALRQAPDVRSLFIEKGDIIVSSGDSVKNARISGSAVNADLPAYRSVVAPYELRLGELNKSVSSADEQTRQDSSFLAGLQQKAGVILGEKQAAQEKYILADPNSYFSLIAFRDLLGAGREILSLEPLFAGLSQNLRKSPEGLKYESIFERAHASSIGAAAPDFTENDPDGKPVKLSDFRGKFVLIDFWASWCQPCRAENPNLVKAFNTYRDRNFTVLGVSLDRPDKKQSWLDAIRADGLVWTQVSDLQFWENKAAKLYGVTEIPQNFLIDPSGRIVARDLRGQELTKKLEELLPKAKGR